MMTETCVEVKIEPMDVDFSVIKEEELDIKTEIEDALTTTVPQQELPNGFCTLYKEEPMTEEELNISVSAHPTLSSVPDFQFECHACQSYFSSEELLLDHNCIENLNETSTRTSLRCSDCQQNFTSEKDIISHECKAKLCKNCEQYFETVSKLEDHKQTRCKFRKRCSMCKQVFLTKFFYDNHIQSHINRAKRLSPNLKSNKSLKQPGAEPFVCNVCEMGFKVAKDLLKHYKKHFPAAGVEQHKKGKKLKKNGVNAAIDVDAALPPTNVTKAVDSSNQTLNASAEVDIPQLTPNKSLQNFIPNSPSISLDLNQANLSAALSQVQPITIPHQQGFTFNVQGNTLILNTNLAQPQVSFSPQNVIFDTQGNAFTLTNTISKLQPLHGPQRLDVIVDGLGNAYALTNTLPQFPPQQKPQRLDVIVDGNGNAFVMKKEDLITGDLQYPQIRTLSNQQVLVDAQGNGFALIQNPEVENVRKMANKEITGDLQYPQIRTHSNQQVLVDAQGNDFALIQNPEVPKIEDLTAITKDHCYTSNFSFRNKAPEPVVTAPKAASTDPIPYNDLLLEELFDRKTKSMAKEREAASRSVLPLKQMDVHQTVESETQNIKEEVNIPQTITEELVVETDTTQPSEDYEDMIVCNKVPNSFRKSLIIENLKDQYQKAKKSPDVSSADESSQNSVPRSIYCKVSDSLNSYATELNVNHRYAWICPSCPRQYFQRHSFVKHLLDHGKKEEEVKCQTFELRPEVVTTPSVGDSSPNTVPPSIYCNAYDTPKSYAKKLNVNYRYAWICPLCPRDYIQRHSFVKHLLEHGKTEKDIKSQNFELRPEVVPTPSGGNLSENSAPPSIYCKVSDSLKSFATKLNVNYRYAWICPSCPRQYVQRHSFVKHMVDHGMKEDEIQSQTFELRPEVLTTPSSDLLSYCTVCLLNFNDEESFEKHIQEYHKDEKKLRIYRFKCHKCGKVCSTRGTLTDHVQQDCGTKPQYGCEVCNKKFYSRSTLQLHRSIHTGELPHKCEYCGKRVRTRGQLTVHRRTHTGERPFPCKVCERRFTHRETLISHLSRHIDMKRYKCVGCGTCFASISGLKMHRENRMDTCGKFKFSAQAVGPRVRVIKGNVMFEPQPKFNPYTRSNDDEPEEDETTKENGSLQENRQRENNIAVED